MFPLAAPQMMTTVKSPPYFLSGLCNMTFYVKNIYILHQFGDKNVYFSSPIKKLTKGCLSIELGSIELKSMQTHRPSLSASLTMGYAVL